MACPNPPEPGDFELELVIRDGPGGLVKLTNAVQVAKAPAGESGDHERVPAGSVPNRGPILSAPEAIFFGQLDDPILWIESCSDITACYVKAPALPVIRLSPRGSQNNSCWCQITAAVLERLESSGAERVDVWLDETVEMAASVPLKPRVRIDEADPAEIIAVPGATALVTLTGQFESLVGLDRSDLWARLGLDGVQIELEVLEDTRLKLRVPCSKIASGTQSSVVLGVGNKRLAQSPFDLKFSEPIPISSLEPLVALRPSIEDLEVVLDVTREPSGRLGCVT